MATSVDEGKVKISRSFLHADNFSLVPGVYLSDIASVASFRGASAPRFYAAWVTDLDFVLPSSLLSTRRPLSTCFSSSRNGGRKRTTVSWVLFNKTPSLI